MRTITRTLLALAIALGVALTTAAAQSEALAMRVHHFTSYVASMMDARMVPCPVNNVSAPHACFHHFRGMETARANWEWLVRELRDEGLAWMEPWEENTQGVLSRYLGVELHAGQSMLVQVWIAPRSENQALVLVLDLSAPR
jgi:hypothetical protein